MSRKLMNLAMMYAAITSYASEYPFGCPSPRIDTPKGNIPSDKQKCQPKKQYEFTIKGVCIKRRCATNIQGDIEYCTNGIKSIGIENGKFVLFESIF